MLKLQISSSYIYQACYSTYFNASFSKCKFLPETENVGLGIFKICNKSDLNQGQLKIDLLVVEYSNKNNRL